MGIMPLFERDSRVGDLVIQRRIGSGAFGVVYLARDELIGRDVAIKVLPTGDERTEQHVLKEARAVGRLSHPNIATLFRVHPPKEHGAWLYELEYVPGSSLAEKLLDNGPLPLDETTRIATAVADALAHAHGRGVVHGDIKPGNVLVTPDARIKLVDFGLARILGDVSLALSESDQPGGTPLYMAPELVLGEVGTPASDIWSYGALLHYMLGGQPPFRGRGIGGLFHAILNEDPDPMTADIPPHLRRLVADCLHKRATDRPPRIEIVLERLQAKQSSAGTRARVAEPAPRLPMMQGQAPLLRLYEPAERKQAEGQGQTVLVSGAAGIGKSAMLRTMRRRARARGALWIDVTISPLHGLHGPLVLALEEAMGIHQEGPPMLDVSTSSRRLVRALFGDKGGTPPTDQRALFWATEQVLRALAERGPLCIALDDAQYADAEDRLLLKHLAQYLPTAGIILVIACRSDETDEPSRSVLEDLLTLTDAIHIPVARLSDAESCAVIEEELGTTRIEPEILAHVTRLAQGNPLLCSEFARHLVESGGVRIEDGQAVRGHVWEATDLPRRFRDLTALRLSAVDETHRQLLDIAAVDGVRFDAPALAAVTGEPALTVLRSLQQIQRRHRLVHATHEGYRFTSAAIRDVVYADLAPEMRRAIHDALARHLEQRVAEGDPRATPLRTGRHWEQAGNAERARPFLRDAVADALGRFEYTRAVALARRSGLLDEELDPATVMECSELLIDLAYAIAFAGDPEGGVRMLELVKRTADEGDPLRERAQVRIANLRYRHEGRAAVDTEALERASSALSLSADRGRAHLLLGMIAKYDNRLDDAETHLKKADEEFRELGIDALCASSLHELASVALRRGTPQTAAALYLDAARVAEQVGRRVNAAASRVNAAIAAFDSGKIDGLAESLEQAIHLMAHEGSPNLVGHTRVVLAHVHWASGNTEAAERNVLDASAILEESQFLPGLSAATRVRTELRGIVGDMAAAAPLFEHAHDLVVRSGNRRIERRINALAMCLHLWNGDCEAAEATVPESLALLREDAAERGPIGLDIAEAVLYGLPVVHAAAARAALEESGESSGAPHALLTLAIACAGGDRASIGGRATEFRELPLAYRRATFHTASRIMALDDPDDARKLLEDVRRIGHFWQELLVLDWLAQREPTQSWDAKFAACAERHHAAPGHPVDLRTLVAGWGV